MPLRDGLGETVLFLAGLVDLYCLGYDDRGDQGRSQAAGGDQSRNPQPPLETQAEPLPPGGGLSGGRRLTRYAVDAVRADAEIAGEWRLTGLDGLVATLEQGRTGTIAGVKAGVKNGEWRFELAPARRPL